MPCLQFSDNKKKKKHLSVLLAINPDSLCRLEVKFSGKIIVAMTMETPHLKANCCSFALIKHGRRTSAILSQRNNNIVSNHSVLAQRM